MHGEGHFAIEDDVRGKPGVGVVGIEGQRGVLPDEDVCKTFGMKLGFERACVQRFQREFAILASRDSCRGS